MYSTLDGKALGQKAFRPYEEVAEEMRAQASDAYEDTSLGIGSAAWPFQMDSIDGVVCGPESLRDRHEDVGRSDRVDGDRSSVPDYSRRTTAGSWAEAA